MNVWETLDRLADEMGWDDVTQVIVLLQAVEGLHAQEDVIRFLERTASEEKALSDGDTQTT